MGPAPDTFDIQQGMNGGDWFANNMPTTGGVTGQTTGQVDPSMPNANQWDQSTFTQQFGTPGTPEELAAIEPQLNAAGIRVSRNAAGVAGKIILPNGQYVDVINSAGIGGKGFQWLTGNGDAPGSAGSNAQAPYNFSTDDPSYKWRLAQGLEGAQKSAAARGDLLTGGTLKDLVNYGQGAASQEYQNAFNRKFSLAGLGENAAAQTGNYGANLAQSGSDSIYGAGNARSAGSIAQGNIWGGTANTIADLFRPRTGA